MSQQRLNTNYKWKVAKKFSIMQGHCRVAKVLLLFTRICFNRRIPSKGSQPEMLRPLTRLILQRKLRRIPATFASTSGFCANPAFRGFCDDAKRKKKSEVPALLNPFAAASEKNKNTYLAMVEIFQDRDVHRRNHVEFIYSALKNMESFGVEHDLDVYKALINVMPKGKFIPTNIFQAEFMHYPKQQQCIIDLLEQMEDYGVMPDYEMEAMLLNIFGQRGHPLRKYWRMMYWMPKFKNLSPWPLPNPMPDDTLLMAQMAVERMCTVDLRSKVSTYKTKDVADAIDDTWVVSGISPEQSELLSQHPRSKAVFIEGPFVIWLRNRTINYFTLRADPDVEFLKSLDEAVYDPDDVSNLEVPTFGKIPKSKYQVGKPRSVHQQDDGTIFAICATGTSTKDSLLSWIRLLEKDANPALGEIPVLFRFKSAVAEKATQIEAGKEIGILDKTNSIEEVR